MISLVLTIIAFAGAMGIPAFLTAIVESTVRPSSWRTGASRRTNWTDRPPAGGDRDQANVDRAVSNGWMECALDSISRKGRAARRGVALTSREKKSNGKRPPPLETTKEASCKPAMGDQNETLRLLASCSYRKGDQNIECVL